MSVIAIVDDKVDLRTTLQKIVQRQLKKLGSVWDVVEKSPFETMQEYEPWLKDAGVCVLMLDEKLDTLVNYNGHELALYLRTVRPDLPQFLVTAIAGVEELEDAGGSLEAVVNKDVFTKRAGVYVERMIRAGQSFLDRNEAQLAELDDLSREVATGRATDEHLQRIKAIRGQTQLPTPIEEVGELAGWVVEAERLCERLEAKLSEIDNSGGNVL